MISIAYLSSATRAYTDEELAQLLTSIRENNARQGITGILLYSNSQFMQVLEGPDDAIRACYAIISVDPRHHGVQLLSVEVIAERRYPSWRMGFRALTDSSSRSIPGYDDFFHQQKSPMPASEAAERARGLLDWFRDNSLPVGQAS
ncbi:BLUF domain-containing protein [Lacisediminihabitans sp. H27-G8]|uniref:BLUF domain-containing protein n=1 Tax=Lacisediminihabitans sp. H27-G8 TaxID=3111909 RepID=UPI0019CE3A91|nr:BLUF domain-containing protein [Microbacteriaceae bacterium]